MSVTQDSGVHDAFADSDSGILIVRHPRSGDRTTSNRPASHSAPDLKSSHQLLADHEIRRRLFHILPGFLPFVLWVIPHQHPLPWDLTVAALLLAVALTAVALVKYRAIRRSPADEPGKFSTVVGYAVPVVLTMLFLPAHVELAFLVLAMIAFGDGMATVGGLYIRGPRLPWNTAKTWCGSACFIVAATAMGGLIYWGEARPQLAFVTALQVSGFTAILSALCESLPSRINDNIRVGVSAAFASILAQWLFVGF